MKHRQASRTRGFTLVEVLVAVAIVAIGLVAILGSFITSFQIIKQSENYNEAVLISLEQMAQLEDKILRGEEISSSLTGEITEGLKKFSWEFEQADMEPYGDLKALDLRIRWMDGKRTGQINWVTHILQRTQ